MPPKRGRKRKDGPHRTFFETLPDHYYPAFSERIVHWVKHAMAVRINLPVEITLLIAQYYIVLEDARVYDRQCEFWGSLLPKDRVREIKKDMQLLFDNHSKSNASSSSSSTATN